MSEKFKQFKCPLCQSVFKIDAEWTPELKDAVAMITQLLGERVPLPLACIKCAPSDYHEMRMK